MNSAYSRRSERDPERAEKARQRDLERQAKEMTKLSALQQAGLEVAAFENQLELLLSVHKEQSDPWDWVAISASLPPPPPARISLFEWKAKVQAVLYPAEQTGSVEDVLAAARRRDDEAFQAAAVAYPGKFADWQEMRSLAQRVVAGDHKSFTEILVKVNPFAEISDLGASIHLTVHTPKLVECVLKVNGKQAIPKEVKTLTSTGKLSVKPMPKARFHEVYQDYACGCVLRVARELLALFPVDTVLVTAVVDSVSQRSGLVEEVPVLSVAIPRAVAAKLDFRQLDPSDSMDNFLHRGDFKASRKAETFQQISPLTPADIANTQTEDLGLPEALARVQAMRQDLRNDTQRLSDQLALLASSISETV
jgi:hypothetical protein